MTGIYIHWPYCLSKCPYCDFYSRVDPLINQDDIINSYIDDIKFYKQYVDDNISTVFFGGGTPSLINPYNIEKIVNYIYKEFKTENLEISLEANPNTNHPNMFKDLKAAGINRLSLGIQSLNQDNLNFLERSHNKEEALNAIEDVLETFDNHSMDIMLGLPQSEDFSFVKGLGFKHLSVYQLTIEEGTAFYKRGYEDIEEEKAIELYKQTKEALSGYNRYEVSNYCQTGFECKHNMGYWQGLDYMGIGKGAHGRLKMNATTHHRQIEKLSPEERAEELLLMGLRIYEGINKERFYTQCGLKFDDFINQKNLNSLKQQALILDDKKTIKVTDKGFYLLNKIIEDLAV